MHSANQSLHLENTDCEVPPTYGNLLRTARATRLHREINPRCLCLSPLTYIVTPLLLLTNIILCVIMCVVSPIQPLLLLCCLQNKSKWSRLCTHSRLSHCVKRQCQRCICCSHISEDTRKRLSVDFICLFGSLPDCWSV